MAAAWVPVAVGVLDALFGNRGDDGESQRAIEEAQRNAAAAQRAADDMKAQNDNLASQISDYQQQQQNLMDSLEREVAARAEQDAQHKQALSEMRAKSERAREEHKEEMKAFRREAKLSEKTLHETRLADLKRERTALNRAFNTKFGEMEQLALQVDTEKVKLQHFTPELNDPSIKRIVLLGLTGDGKSTVGNRLVGDVSEDGDRGGPNGGFRTSGGVESETQTVVKVLHEAYGVRISVVDTPGISDSSGRGRDRQHITNLVGYLRGCGGVNQFLITKNQSNPRLSDTYQGMLRELEHALGPEFWQFVTVLLTHVEGRRALRDFERHKDELCGEIASKFQCGRLQGVGIGMDDYEEVVRDIVTRVVPNRKFTCESLVSPLEELERDLVGLKAEVVEAKQAVEVVEEKIRQVNASLRDIEEVLRQ